ncbi:hypothetical protein [Nocardioides piscis]|uniref:Uncharacterized protein n=1 Tax=Nocardioides piscis TaxID=2714938 RepID=A0A6G7YEW0_9ACTN|nr:hypothetical protein [Nocardioides piscis]QIK75181.1 hypothetical protein G7071_06830 [Nocardioides piscis]
MLPRLEIVRRLRPIDLLAPGSSIDLPVAGAHPMPMPAPGATVVMPGGEGTLAFRLGDHRLAGSVARGHAALVFDHAGRTSTHRSRRHGRCDQEPSAMALTLTGTQLTLLTCEAERWVGRARIDLADPATRVDVHDEALLAGLQVECSAPATAGRFGQLGLRDIRLVTARDGSPVRDRARLLISATSAGPGFFATAHTSVWSFDPDSFDLEHRSDLWFRRPDRPGVYGDHATHVVRDGDGWLVATSTWGDFRHADPKRSVRATIARTRSDVTTGVHVLDTEELPLPTDGFRSVGVWDPHLVHTGHEWLVGFASARKFFRFHPALASGRRLEELSLRAAATDRRATEGTTLVKIDGQWRVLASDGPAGRRGQRRRHPVFDLDLREVGELAAAYPTNLPWPTLVETEDGWLMLTFNGRPTGGRLLGYGTHGDLVVQRETGRV